MQKFVVHTVYLRIFSYFVRVWDTLSDSYSSFYGYSTGMYNMYCVSVIRTKIWNEMRLGRNRTRSSSSSCGKWWWWGDEYIVQWLYSVLSVHFQVHCSSFRRLYSLLQVHMFFLFVFLFSVFMLVLFTFVVVFVRCTHRRKVSVHIWRRYVGIFSYTHYTDYRRWLSWVSSRRVQVESKCVREG